MGERRKLQGLHGEKGYFGAWVIYPFTQAQLRFTVGLMVR